MHAAAARLGATASVVEDSRLADGADWDPRDVAEIARRGIERLLEAAGPASDRERAEPLIVTFDERGASGHANHVATFRGLVLLRAAAAASREDPLSGATFLRLESAPLVGRFLGALAIPLGIARARCDGRPSLLFTNVNVVAAFRALAAHRTQLVWFRKLFLVFSVYTFFNRLFELEPDPG